MARFTLIISGVPRAGHPLVKNAAGTWTVDGRGRTLTLTLTALPGQPPISPDQATRRYTVSTDGRTLASDHAGEPPLVRRR